MTSSGEGVGGASRSMVGRQSGIKGSSGQRNAREGKRGGRGGGRVKREGTGMNEG